MLTAVDWRVPRNTLVLTEPICSRTLETNQKRSGKRVDTLEVWGSSPHEPTTLSGVHPDHVMEFSPSGFGVHSLTVYSRRRTEWHASVGRTQVIRGF
jgi:hypothetical protein